MPTLFDALAGAGQAAAGAQAYRAGELDLEGKAANNRGHGIQNQAGAFALARAIKEARDEDAMKATWAKALGEIMSLRNAQAPSGPEADVDAFYAGKDNPTRASLDSTG